MNTTLFTIGFTKKTAEEFFRLLREAGVREVVDIRENRGGQLSGFAKYPDLAFFLNEILGVSYEHQPLLAPSPEIRDAYRKTKDWEQYEKSFGELMLERKVLESVARAAESETEVTLGLKAAHAALSHAGVDPEIVDALVATSATSVGFPSIAALLHNRLLLRESCAAVDVGGACVGVIHGLASAQGLLDHGRRRVALIVASEVNSRALARPGVPGEFRGLFGDGACAFVLQHADDHSARSLRLGEFVSGCSGAFSSSLGVTPRDHGELDVVFKGKQLASAAVTTLNQVVGNLEDLSGKRRSEVDCFTLHEPNPRLVEIFAQQARIPLDRICRTAHTSGNLGSVTCGVNLCTAFTRFEETPSASRNHVIFAAAVGPGLLWAGTYLSWIEP